MTNQEIFDLMARFDASGITTFKLDTKELTLELSKGSAAPLSPPPSPPPPRRRAGPTVPASPHPWWAPSTPPPPPTPPPS